MAGAKASAGVVKAAIAPASQTSRQQYHESGLAWCRALSTIILMAEAKASAGVVTADTASLLPPNHPGSSFMSMGPHGADQAGQARDAAAGLRLLPQAVHRSGEPPVWNHQT